ncbi:unnamed protein product, partial [Adineta steineri]
FRKDDFQNTTNDGNAQCITIAVDNENNVTEFLAQIDLTRLLVDKIQELADETKNINIKMLEQMADHSININKLLENRKRVIILYCFLRTFTTT